MTEVTFGQRTAMVNTFMTTTQTKGMIMRLSRFILTSIGIMLIGLGSLISSAVSLTINFISDSFKALPSARSVSLLFRKPALRSFAQRLSWRSDQSMAFAV